MEPGFLVAADGPGVVRRWVDLHPRDPRVLEQALDEGAHNAGAEALAEPRAVGEELVDAVDALVLHLEPPALGMTRGCLVRLEVADRRAVENRQVLGDARLELDAPLPPLGHVRA